MGALTDNRKRCFLDLCLPSSPPTSPPLPSAPPFKKPRLPQPPPLLRQFPPATPLPRPLHGPQRVLRAFRLGSPSAIPKPSPQTREAEAPSDMGGLVSRIRRFSRLSEPSTDPMRDRDTPREGLALEEYKKMVVDVQEGRLALAETRRQFSPPQASDLTVVTLREEDASPAPAAVVSRKVGDARRVALEATPVPVRKVPVYKELLQASARKYDSRLSSLEFEVRLTEKKISGFRLAAEAAEKKSKGDVHGLFTPLTEEEEDEVYHAMHNGHSEEVLVTHEPSNLDITRGILQCLSCSAWLNDEVINLYLELLKEREKRDPKKFLKCHFFNTFFYKKLSSGRNGYDFKAVRRWTTQRKIGYGLIDCDKIFVPIHKEVHWCLAIIDVKDEKLQYLDSLGGIDTTVLRLLARYFMDEVKDKSEKNIDASSWKQEAVVDLPLQTNGWDCGMFMLKYIDFYSRGFGLSFSQEHMAYFRKRTAKEILRLRAE